MSRSVRTSLIALAVLLCFFGGAGTARAEGRSNVVVAVNTNDGRFLYRVSLRIQRSAGDVVDEGNAAVAFASCDACTTVAIAIQALLVFGDPSRVTPTNLAFAYNLECSFCHTLASAYQYVLMSDGPVHLTSDGNRVVAEVRRELQQLRHACLTIFELQERVDGLARRLQDVLFTELAPAGTPR